MSANGNTGTSAPPGDMVIRDVTDDDMEAVREIYSHHVLDGLASFEEVPPDVAEMTRRRDALRAQGDKDVPRLQIAMDDVGTVSQR